MSTPPFRSRLGATFAAVAVAAVASLATASAASAHDELVSTDPAAGSSATALPSQLTLTFSGELLADPGATEVRVTDAAGTSLTAGDPVVAGTVVTQPLTAVAGSPGGEVTVLWRVVSSDGHPISDGYSFTVAAAPSPTPTGTPTPTPTASATPSASAPAAVPPDSSATPLPGPPMAAVDMRPWFIGGGILLLAIAGAVAYLLVSRARRRSAGAPTTTASDGTSGTSDGR